MKNIIGRVIFTALFLQLLLAASFSVFAQTPVSGLISVNTVWATGSSPYIVTGNILVQNGVTLTIEPGVTVKFDAGKAIQIDGELIAKGERSNRIVFTSNGSQTNGYWAKIQFSDMSVDASYDSVYRYVSGSIMRYCDVLFGGGSNTGAIQCNNASPYICCCRISRSSSCGLFFSQFTARVDSSTISDNALCGIYSEELHYKGWLNILYDTIKNNPYGGIFFGYSGSSFAEGTLNTISRCVFIANAGHGAIWVDDQVHHLNISKNIFTGNSSTMGGAIYFNSAIYINIYCNQFINNHSSGQGGAILFSTGMNLNSSTIQSNIFRNNTSSGQGAAIFLDGGYDNHPSTYKIFNNFLRNNYSSAGGVLYIRGNQGTSSVVTEFQVTNNYFIDNQTPYALFIETFKGTISHNNFMNPVCEYELYNNNGSGELNVSAVENYWGTGGTQHVDSAIYDFFDDANHSYVNYLPVLSEVIYVDTTCVPPPVGLSIPRKSATLLSFRPNPCSDYTEITLDRRLADGELEMFNSFGKKVLTLEHIGSDHIILKKGNLAAGLYIVRIIDRDYRFFTGKLIIE
jgi:predicted outer membrane repeat protein